jgi:hypothetical protein
MTLLDVWLASFSRPLAFDNHGEVFSQASFPALTAFSLAFLRELA